MECKKIVCIVGRRIKIPRSEVWIKNIKIKQSLKLKYLGRALTEENYKKHGIWGALNLWKLSSKIKTSVLINREISLEKENKAGILCNMGTALR